MQWCAFRRADRRTDSGDINLPKNETVSLYSFGVFVNAWPEEVAFCAGEGSIDLTYLDNPGEC